VPKNFRIFLIVTISIIVICGAVVSVLLIKTANSPKKLQAEIIVNIPNGSSIKAIGKSLYDATVIDVEYAEIFQLIYKLYGEKKPLLAGEFVFSGDVSVVDVMKHLQSGEFYYRKITIPEGYTTLRILESVMSADALEGELKTDLPEGALLPDTYYYSHGDLRMDVVDRMMAERNRVVSLLWRSRNKAIDDVVKTPDDAVILASIVEKETGAFDERSRITGVFINRLRKGMKLQSDPTTIYSLTRGFQILGRSLTKKDLSFESPFNTYHVKGLPPAPICNPGREALEAVLHPTKTDDLYFVSNNKGGHYFAKTLTQHNQNVQKYRANKP
jgi:UPF0755 protein